MAHMLPAALLACLLVTCLGIRPERAYLHSSRMHPCGMAELESLPVSATLGDAKEFFASQCRARFPVQACVKAAEELWHGTDSDADFAFSHDSAFCQQLRDVVASTGSSFVANAASSLESGFAEKRLGRQEPDNDADHAREGLASAEVAASPTCDETDEKQLGKDEHGCVFDPISTERTTGQIELHSTGTMDLGDSRQFQWRWYRNDAYKCAVSGNPSFLVIEPKGWVGREEDPADMFIYIHGGGFGYFDSDGVYTPSGSKEYAHEEDSDALLAQIFGRAVKPWPPQSNSENLKNIFWNRLKGGWRILAVSMCDHDGHLGRGNEEELNPSTDLLRRKVDGLQAALSAVDYMQSTFKGKSSLICGTSAGTRGAWAMTMTLASEGRAPTGTLLDSGINTPRSFCLPPGTPDDVAKQELVLARMGWWADPNAQIYLEKAIAGGFNATSIFQIYGAKDALCGGNAPKNTWPDFPDSGECDAKGVKNPCIFKFLGLESALTEAPQPNWHRLVQVPRGGHVVLDDDNELLAEGVEKWIANVAR